MTKEILCAGSEKEKEREKQREKEREICLFFILMILWELSKEDFYCIINSSVLNVITL